MPLTPAPTTLRNVYGVNIWSDRGSKTQKIIKVMYPPHLSFLISEAVNRYNADLTMILEQEIGSNDDSSDLADYLQRDDNIDEAMNSFL